MVGKVLNHYKVVARLGQGGMGEVYAAATGRRPFQGDSAISTLSAILRETPAAVTDLNPSLPHHLGRVVGYCLAKDPDGRYQSALELRRELNGLREESASGEPQAPAPAVTAAPAKPGAAKWIGLGLGAIALLAAVFGVIRLLPDRVATDRAATAASGSGGAAAANMEMVLLTSTGHAGDSAISPDGRYVAYVERPPAPGYSVWVSHVGTGSKVRVVEPSMTFFIWDPTFSPQSDYVFFIGFEWGKQPALYRVPVLGGTPRKVADNVGQSVSFSPQGDRFVFTREELGTAALVISSIDGSGQRVIASRNYPEDFDDPSWSPDGTTIAAAASTMVPRQANVALIPVDGGRERLLLPAGWGTVVEGMGLSWTPDGRIVFGSAEGNEFHLEVIDADGRNRQRITSRGGLPRVTPDGEWIVFLSNRAETTNIWRSRLDGSDPVRLTRGKREDDISLSPDGRWVVFVSRVGGSNVMRVAIEGGAPTPINDRVSDDPAVSPDGTRIAVKTWDDEAKRWGLDVIPFDGGEPIHRLDIPPGDFKWSPDGESLTVSVDEAGTDNLFIYPLDGGERRKLTDFAEPFIGHFAWSPDGKRIAMARGSFSSDVVLLRNIR